MAKAKKPPKPPKPAKPEKPVKPEKLDGLRIRMYRVGFGDFFLISVPSKAGPQHILIDCGVTRGTSGKGDIASIKTAVRHMAAVTNNTLALIVVTHRHMDHIIGFSRCEEEFLRFKDKVGAIWMPHWERDYPKAVKLQADIEQLALGLNLALGARKDATAEEIRGIAWNATGVTDEGPGGGTNKRSLDLLKNRLGVKPTYLGCGDDVKLPDALADAGVSATILGPPPPREFDYLKIMDLRKGEQYLSADAGGGTSSGKLRPFAREFECKPQDYPFAAYREWEPREKGKPPSEANWYPDQLRKAVKAATPDGQLMAARKLDSVLNNQSLVVLFTWKKRRLLFAGDAQAGSWVYWLYDLAKATKELKGVKLAKEATEILGSLDFYKAGHHGSTNSTPIVAVAAMRAGKGLVTMCSTEHGTYGSEHEGTEVPRLPLMEALEEIGPLIRSDFYAATVNGKTIPSRSKSAIGKPKLPKGAKLVAKEFYLDYTLT